MKALNSLFTSDMQDKRHAGKLRAVGDLFQKLLMQFCTTVFH